MTKFLLLLAVALSTTMLIASIYSLAESAPDRCPPGWQKRGMCEQTPTAIPPEPTSTPVPSNEQELPVHVVVVIPKDFDYYVFDPNEVFNIVVGWATDTEAWYQQETGETVRLNPILAISQYTLLELQTFEEQVGTVVARDECGEGIHESAVTELVLDQELNLFSAPYHRIWTVVLGGGGWAGGRSVWNVEAGIQINHGRMFLGDWGIRNVLGVGWTPCQDEGYRIDKSCGAFGHESLHSMFTDSHNPVVFCGDPLTDEQVGQFLSFYNDEWLPQPVAPVATFRTAAPAGSTMHVDPVRPQPEIWGR